MQPVRTNRIADSADFARQFGVSRETVERLTVYATLLTKWQKTINLVAPSTLGEVWHRHFADSAQVVGLVGAPSVSAPPLRPVKNEEVRHWLDLGSGGGFPGLVAGIMLAERGGWGLTMIESDQRKCAFLREVVRETGIKSAIAVDIVADRIEARANHTRDVQVDVVSARALAAMPQLLQWAEPYFSVDTVGIFLKGKDAAAEVAKVPAGWACELLPSVTDADARVVRVHKVLKQT
jgi:16S rRNA (guanine527-N7)-methyltransferase